MKEILVLFVCFLCIAFQAGCSSALNYNWIQPLSQMKTNYRYHWTSLNPSPANPLIIPQKQSSIISSPEIQPSELNTIIHTVTSDTYSKLDKPALKVDLADDLVLVNKDNKLPFEYVPENLVTPRIKFASTAKQLRKDAATALEKLVGDAEYSGIIFYVVSGYRSYRDQKTIYTDQLEKRGPTIANLVSAKPGYSEHQTGLAVDITSDSVDRKLVRTFGRLKEGLWLKENAYKYGFILRYPQGKESITKYYYEPWHIRYVGVSAAAEIYHRDIVLEEYDQNYMVNNNSK